MDFTRINGRYRLQRKIGSGSFVDRHVFFACDILLLQDVMIKLEPLTARQHLLEHEYHVYQKLSGGVGILQVRWFGTEGGFDTLALNLLGQSLEDLFIGHHFKFTIQTIVRLANQLVCRLEYIHSCNFNIADIVYLIDFGLLKEYRISPGTTTFASINSHLGLELGRRDDMESTCLYSHLLPSWLFCHGSACHVGHRTSSNTNKEHHVDLCHGLPVEFCTLLEHCRSLSFERKNRTISISAVFSMICLHGGFPERLGI
ncbi:casein kinase I delta [Lactarius deliciosus]|nr:casein kinase I delta [Lactarius deliciosus]